MKLKNIMIVMILSIFLVVPIVGASDPSKYVTIAPLTGTPYGTLNIHVLCQHNLFSKEIVMYQSGGNPLDNTTIELFPDGKYTGIFNPGKFDFVLIDGNGGHSEYRTAEIKAGQTTTVWFIGHAVSMDPFKKNITPEPTPTPTPTPNETPSPTPTPTPTPTQCVPTLNIVSAQYGFVGQDCKQILVNASWNETVIDTPAYTQFQISTWQIVTPEVPAWTEYLGNAKQDGSSHNYKIVGQGANDADYTLTKQSCSHIGEDYCYQNGNGVNYKCIGFGDYKLTKPGHIHHAKIPAVYGWVVTSAFQNGTCSASISCTPKPGDTKCEERVIPATYKEITHPAVYEEQCSSVGAMVDVTQNVKDVVSQGTTSFIFDNRPSPGGIFDITGTHLLSEITDPAYGYVKSVKITYNMGCDSQNQDITAAEYEVINL